MIKIKDIEFKQKSELIELKYKTREMIYKEPKSIQDIQFIIFGLSRLLRPVEKITFEDWPEYAEIFLDQYFHEYYVCSKEEPQTHK